AFPPSVITVVFYCGSVTLFFAAIKLVSFRLHLMFDQGEVVLQGPSKRKDKPDRDRAARHEPTTSRKIPSHRQTHSGKKEEASRNLPTPPLLCSSRGHGVSSHHSSGPSGTVTVNAHTSKGTVTVNAHTSKGTVTVNAHTSKGTVTVNACCL
ncbi:Pecanex-like protein 2, partial [Tupaia chinensis]